VENFSRRLASNCKLTFVPLLQKTHARQQKHMENSAHQCANALESFSVLEGAVVPEKVLLVDDVVDSRWTLTVCGYRLMEQGCQEVFPFALADSSQKEG
jgi:ATP-dependent DNA helicase RecQ